MEAKQRSRSQNGKTIPLRKGTDDLLSKGKQFANDLYEDSVHTVNEVQENIAEYSDELARKIKQNPITSVLVAAGVGYLLSRLLNHK